MVPAQLPSVDTFLVGAEGGAEEERVVDEGRIVDDGWADEVVGLLFVQLPKAVLQPVPQWAVVEPHQPYCEQQLPNGLLKHV